MRGYIKMLVDLLKSDSILAKSKGLSLFDHLVQVTQIAQKIITLWGKGFDEKKRKILLLGSFLHDIGKIDPVFQKMLRGEKVVKRIKHEANTIDYEDAIRSELTGICKFLSEQISEKITVDESIIDDILAFAATHHGLFYISRENGKWRIRREWTVFNLKETERITLIDLLFEYYPFGGIVIIADLIQSYCFEKQIDWTPILRETPSYSQLVNFLIKEQRIIEDSLKLDEPRDYNLKDILTLIGGGIDA